MSSTPLIQYLPLVRPQSCFRYAHKLSKKNVMCILDLEDSAQNIFDQNKTKSLKKEAQDGLRYISKYTDWPTKQKLYIRTNSADSIFFNKDIDAVLTSVRNGMPVTGIFLPKVEDYSTISQLHKFFSENGIEMEIVPMIETRFGLIRLEEMLRKDMDTRRIKRVHYGHFDFCFDSNIWPFPEPRHVQFWALIESILNILSEFDVAYVHTPFPYLYDTELFWATIAHLRAVNADTEMWAATLNSELSLSERPLHELQLEITDINYKFEEKIAAANKVVNSFLVNAANKRSFSVINGKFVPPHEYLAAKKFLV